VRCLTRVSFLIAERPEPVVRFGSGEVAHDCGFEVRARLDMWLSGPRQLGQVVEVLDRPAGPELFAQDLVDEGLNTLRSNGFSRSLPRRV
jgi:hypothetical protein